MKFCPGCKEEKALTDFPKNKSQKSGLHHYCKLCAAAAARARYERINSDPAIRAAFLEKERERGVRRRHASQSNPEIAKKNFDIVKKSILKCKFGITVEVYNEMFEKQQGRCAICRNPETKRYRNTGVVQMLSVDHNHKTGAIRELLCDNCNVSLGRLRENTEAMRNMALYVEKHRGLED